MEWGGGGVGWWCRGAGVEWCWVEGWSGAVVQGWSGAEVAVLGQVAYDDACDIGLRGAGLRHA